MRAALLLLIACGSAAEPRTGDPALPGVELVDEALQARLATPGHLYTNRLALETSPYLLQHAHNPVSWYAWGDEPFARARREHKLVLLSIGYSTCHWCHVMEHESFEDEAVARELNAHFICIKVDREERPDLDARYMRALTAMTGSGGWPMTMITDGERRPVFGASYLPKPRLMALLAQLRAASPAQLEATARELTAPEVSRTGTVMPGPDAIATAVARLAASFDPVSAGFGRGHKFPSVPDLELLLRYQRRARDPVALELVIRTLDAMTAGGIHDVVGGGFHRYATDRAWLVPHFEKMLYDNAQLAIVYLEAAQVTHRADLAAIAADTLTYLLRDLRSPEGAFYGATDADSPTEGRYFTWTDAELAGIPLDRSARVDGRVILHGTLDDATRRALLARRQQRPPPPRDEKVLASWNGLAISAFARVGLALGRPDFIDAATRAATTILARLADGPGLHRSFARGEARLPGTLDDYAMLIAGLLDLRDATGDRAWLERAVALAATMELRLGAPGGGYYASVDAPPFGTRDVPAEDGPEPSGNAVAVLDDLRLAELTGDERYRARAEKALARLPALHAGLLVALDQALDTPLEIAIVGPSPEGLLAEVRAAYLPGAWLQRDGKPPLHGVATAYVCEHGRCQQPTTDAAQLATQLAAVHPLYPDRSPAPLAIPPR